MNQGPPTPPGPPNGPPGPSYGGGGWPGQGAPQGPGYPGWPVAQSTNSKAIASLVIGLTSLVLFWLVGAGLLGIVAVVLGLMARSEIRRSGGREQGDGLAIAGIITGAMAAVLVVVLVALLVWMVLAPTF